MESTTVKTYNEKILVADCDVNVRQVLETRLSILGYKVVLASNGKQALELFKTQNPNLVILDILLPQIDGYEVCSKIRQNSGIPIILLTALGDVTDCIKGLELGADDYITKPFSPTELEARIRTVLRRLERQNSPTPTAYQNVLVVGQLEIDINKRQVFKKGCKVRLTDIEFSLLELLIKNSGESVYRSAILKSIWGYSPEKGKYADTRVVDVHISRLRAKLEENANKPDLILTARGTGYMFQKCN